MDGIIAGIGPRMIVDPELSLAWHDHPEPERGSISDLVRSAAARSPDVPALIGPAGTMTYGELIARADHMRAALIARGARRGDLIAVLSGRDLDLPALLLGVLDAGCGYVPIAPHYPRAFTESVLAAAQPSLIVVAAGMSQQFGPEWQNRVIMTDAITRAGTAPPPAARASDTAYVIFTSGSTGRPKGVVVRHENVTRLMVSPSYATIDSRSIALALSPPSFDAAVFDLWPFLAAGARVVLHPDAPPTPDSIAELVRRHGVTTAFITTGVFNRTAEDRPDALAGVEVLTGGERGSAEAARRILDARASAVVHCYGPTETAVFTTTARFTPASSPSEPFPIGRPVAGTACYVLDPDQRPVAFGTEGELWIGGEAVATGYLGDVQLTRERFRPDPFRPGALMYRSGDGVCMQRDGSLVFLERLDEQLKIRGHRVEPGAIARHLEAIDDVRGAIVLAAELSPGDVRLHAFVTTSATHGLTEAQLRSQLQADLPAAMVPSRIVIVPSFPLSANGKIDREALLSRLRADASSEIAFDDPNEAAVAALFTSILKLAPAGAADDFFDLGGDSLLAMRLLGQLRAQLGWHGTLQDLYTDATVRGIARRLADAAAMPFEAGVL
ncbi:putative Non-ribosomal peptide synthetase/polyketide synthase [Bradyrhizobium sp. ORS 285]|uniref:non-ribosomal peptide synthetase n=1 Tax=Bradyrhizobium sp. ORS 285 TaxID=115808 RepID=UPI0002406CA8|nr:non-ribosomal peptide synthetase [Bradyrhizobium sp. ORS 285]CCD83739.1 putative Non-ribosomal peptide synthetase/polyketide synthase [Bradyrhizobium sp. ORS 285]SMX59285.1 putative Non-ribosomal peptide synthetase/polyketide synthase [Bradyrhizobium sp. ORS 285]